MNWNRNRQLRFIVVLIATSGQGWRCLDAQEAMRPKDPPKLTIVEKLPPPPLLADSNRPPSESVPLFIDWASRSGIDQRETARKIISAARPNSAVAEELCRQIIAHQNTDFSRTLIELSVLGEMRNPSGEKCLVSFLHQPFPTKGTVANGEIVEQTTLGSLQSKAVDGLAYAATETGDREVLWAAKSHPSRIVRAEAIHAYLWNHKDSSEARSTLQKIVRPDEIIFLDRQGFEPGTSREEFNEKLAAYASKHPAPEPVRGEHRKLTAAESVADGPPPKAVRQPVSQPPTASQSQNETK
jgi:hypothetical protein